MYVVPLKTAITEALRGEFANAVNIDFRGENKPKISIEFPIDQSHYPGIWVQYADNGELTVAGIAHKEVTVDEINDTVTTVSRWEFTGTVSLTVVALSSWERDRLYDELVASHAAAQMNMTYPYRVAIESNDLVGMKANWDDAQPFGDQASQGTPWNTDEAIYEKSLSFDVIGEFVTRPETKTLVPLSKVTFMKYLEGTETPLFPDEPGSTTEPPTPGDWDRTQGWI